MMISVLPFLLAPIAGLPTLVAAPAPLASQAPARAADELPAPPELAGGVRWGDHDGDGRLDALSVAGGRLRLLASRAGSGFEDVTANAGLGDLDALTLVLWGDYDGDGRSDLFAGRSAGASLLLRNEGGSFADVSFEAGLAIDEPVLDAHWLDEDGDGRLDLHVVTSASNRIWRGLAGGSFEPVDLPLEVGGAPVLSSAPAGIEAPGGGAADSLGPARDAGRPAETTDRDPAPSNAPALGRPQASPPPTSGGTSALLPFPVACATSIRDQANPGSCLQASSVATLGMLYPLSSKLFVEEATGEVGIGTTTPSYRLHVNGKIVSGIDNSASGGNAALCGGVRNQAGGAYAAVGGGIQNIALGIGATIGGGWGNRLGSGGYENTIGGGSSNRIEGSYTVTNTIGGGLRNSIEGDYSLLNTIGGGQENTAGGSYISNSTVAGGWSNAATGQAAAIPGGRSNTAAGDYSFAAGRRAKATHAGSFVWGDGQDLDKPSSAADEFSVYSEGGLRVFAAGVATPSMVVDSAGNVGIGTTAPAYRLHVVGKLVSGTDTSAPGADAVVSGGRANSASAEGSTVSGGSFNQASGAVSTIGGGQFNRAEGGSSVIAGGVYNLTAGYSCAIGGGYGNSAGGLRATVGGGWYNRCASDVATISGGTSNRALATGAAVGGGGNNEASGSFASVPGGASNLAAEEYSFAAGRRAKALHAGSFVWGDSQDVDKSSSADDQFNVYAEGGLRVFSTGAVKPSLVVDKGGHVGLGTSTPAFTLEVDGTAGKPGGGSWSVSSDARLKKNVEDLEGALDTLLALRGVTFEYIDPKAIGELAGRRIGFIAQEVEEVLSDWVAEKENGTKYLTIRGFEALAVEALRELEADKDAELAELRAEVAAKDARITGLEARVEQLESVRVELAALRAELAALAR